jgi:hypothetical protein
MRWWYEVEDELIASPPVNSGSPQRLSSRVSREGTCEGVESFKNHRGRVYESACLRDTLNRNPIQHQPMQQPAN